VRVVVLAGSAHLAQHGGVGHLQAVRPPHDEDPLKAQADGQDWTQLDQVQQESAATTPHQERPPHPHRPADLPQRPSPTVTPPDGKEAHGGELSGDNRYDPE
jgi:hypothetical protein